MESLSWLPMFMQLVLLGPQEALVPSQIRVYVVPHHHVDMGWLHTVQVGVFNDPCLPLGAAVPFYPPTGIQCGFVSWVCTTGRVSLGSGSASVMDDLCGRTWADHFLSLWFSFPTCTGEYYRQQRSDDVRMGLRKAMVTGPVWGPALHPEVHFCREQGPQDFRTGCSLCPEVFLPRCLRGSVPLYLLVVPEKGFHGEVFLAALPTLL